MESLEKERLKIPVAAFQFWEQQDFIALLNKTVDKSVFYKFNPGEEKTQGIVYLLIEMFKIRRNINMHLEMAKEYFKQKWSKPVTGYWIIKSLCKFKSSGIKKIFKELPVFECKDDYTKAMDYLFLARTAYKAVAEAIFNRLVNVTIVCNFLNQCWHFKHTRISSGVIQQSLPLRSAANIFLVETRGEFHKLKSNMLEKEESRIGGILTPASIFVGHYLKEFYSKFDSIYTDSMSLVKNLEEKKFNKTCFLFTIDFKSLYTNIPVEDAINSIKQLV